MDAFEAALRETLDKTEAKGLLRTLRVVEEDKNIRVFSTNNYLGLATDEKMKEAAAQAIQLYGTGSGGSRLTTGNFTLHEQLEKRIASFKRKEDAIVFSSGYLANLGIISALMREGDAIFSDALNHASIIDGCRMSKAQTFIYQHANMQDLEEKLQRAVHSKKKLIVTDGIFSMDGTIAPLPEIVELAERYGAWVMVDDAHATGVLGKTGAGTAEHFGLSDRVQLTMGTLSKAIGAEGGYVAAAASVTNYLRNYARSFIFQTSLSPGVVAAAMKGIELIQSEPERRQTLQENATYMRSGLQQCGFTLIEGNTPIIAVIIGDAKQAVHFSRLLEEEGIFAPAIRPPTVAEGSSRIRVTVMATHTISEIKKALASFEKIRKEIGIIG
ncbi:8-amino-7-oxononanoate synthase [Aneurinibacillus soli]|uniref:8-amino-7-ketopelargonate synthase n=1 Tax=Aneurinibacillus soli TaxID=1500254 RepID=A0A0U5AXT6_9BACL|nr:8-amino-7-oxononanoate synthase [Aneurinibacillus soli]PYE62257.1 8-amino-7-oxononanoate synthase [Aneurinibacillus soli]BAU28554.1 8-amino-7-oxononanoate synthase [Aneurinibacillus soli]